jgi:DNA-binding beta-propeller fold protein YncE
MSFVMDRSARLKAQTDQKPRAGGPAVSRRTLLAATLAASCGRQLASRYFGWLFIASAGEKALAIADLSQFRRVTSIPLPQVPAEVFRVGGKVFTTCPDARALYEIDPENFRIAGKTGFPGRIAGSAVCPSGHSIAVLIDQPAALYLVDPATRRITHRTALPGVPSGIDATDDMAAVTTETGNSVIRVSLGMGTGAGAIAGVTALGLRAGIVRMQQDAGLILIGAADRNEIVTVNTETGAVLARLPLAFTPARFCFNDDGGQMFVTGTSGDQIAIFSPYQSEVEQTIAAGRTPYGMAVGSSGARNLLFITNRDSGDLTVFDIDTRRLASSIHVGGKPGEVLLTPDGEYALTIDRESGDVAVVRIKTVLDRWANEPTAPMVKPVFTIFHTGSGPQSGVIVPDRRRS